MRAVIQTFAALRRARRCNAMRPAPVFLGRPGGVPTLECLQ